jgi:ABC-type oligopeptide transport system substrate-binding subunit
MNRARVALLPALALALALAASAACTMPGAKLAVTARAAAGARPGGVLRVAITPPGTIDPTSASDPAAQVVVGTMCHTLVTIDPVTGDPLPGLAASWVVADGGRSILFKLRKGIRFHDGSRLTSKEVVASLRRLADPSSASYASPLLADLAGYDELAKSTAEDVRALLRGVRAVEPLSFEVVFDQGRHPDFVRALAHPATAPVRTDLADRSPAEFAAAPICAGPYRVAEPFAVGADHLRLVRARGRGAAGGMDGMTRGGAGYADEIEFRILPDAAAGFEAWRRGEVDVAAVPPERLAQARLDHPESVVVGAAPSIEFIGVSTTERSPFPDPSTRRALADVLDRAALAREVYGGARAPATGFLPPALGRVARADACRFGGQPTGFKPPDGPVTLTFNDEFRNRQLAEAVARQWRDRLGLEVRLVPMGWDDYLAKAALGEGFDGLFRVSWSPRYPSGLEYLGPLFHSINVPGTNFERYTSLDFDRDFDLRAAAADDERERDLELQRLEDRLCREVPLIPIVFGQAAFAVRAERVGAARSDGRMTTLAGGPLLRELYVR